MNASDADSFTVVTYMPGAPEPAGSVACAGKPFEHHERTEITGDRVLRWKCPECGNAGTFEATFGMLAALLPQMYELRAKLNAMSVVFLVPSGATPGLLGQFHQCDVFRVHGIPGPMAAMPAREIPLLTS